MTTRPTTTQEPSVGIRERLNQNRLFAIVAASVMIVGGIAIGLRQVIGSGAEARKGPQLTFFSADDGRTWFPGDAAKLPPIEHEGKTAYRVRVFKCPADGSEFVSHLERFSAEDKKQLEAQITALLAEGRKVDVAQMGVSPTMQVKKPGNKDWLSMRPQTSAEYQRVTQPRCPTGHTEGLEPLSPP
jgi:hypothetical protein